MIKPITNFQGYFIDSSGKVYCNLGKGNRNKCKIVDMYEIKPRLTKQGYTRIYARQNSTGKRKDLYVHRLVAEAFIPNPDKKQYVNHINCIRNDNRVENLEWCTAKENAHQTEKLHHIIRNSEGKYVSNYTYTV
jgi:hypothetical protein